MNIAQLMQTSVAKAPDSKAFTLLLDGETQEISVTYGQLDRQARQVGAALQRLGMQGERVVLAFPFCLDYVTALLGCAYAGAVAVITYPPVPNRPLTSLESAAADAQAKAVMTTQAVVESLKGAIPDYPFLNSLHWLDTQTIIREEDPASWHDPALSEDAPFLLSYTSGSTSDPRGVLLTRQNILVAMGLFEKQYSFAAHSTGVFSAPLHHAGIAIAVIATLINHMHVVMLPTQTVLERPLRWLQAITRYRSMYSGGFSFLVQLCLQYVSPAERDALDLSSLKVLAFSGERIVSHLLERFVKYFEPAGLQKDSLMIGYGLTEATFATVSQGLRHLLFRQDALLKSQAVPADGEAEEAVDITSCGKPYAGRLIIVDPASMQPCAERHVGEVWISGPHVAAGYWRQPDLTEKTFRAFIEGTGEGPYLRTGDLGFLMDGDLYITGRQKDIIILRGQNYYAPDFEQPLIGLHPAMAPGGSAAIGQLVSGEEQLVVVQELLPAAKPDDFDDVIHAIRNKITETFQQPVYAVVLVEQGKLPRTATRKIQRFRCLQEFEEGRLNPLKTDILPLALSDRNSGRMDHVRPPQTPTEGALLGIWLGVLKPEQMISADDNLFAIGGDSLDAAQIAAHVRDVFNIDLPMEVFFESPTISGMAQFIDQQRLKTDTAGQ